MLIHWTPSLLHYYTHLSVSKAGKDMDINDRLRFKLQTQTLHPEHVSAVGLRLVLREFIYLLIFLHLLCFKCAGFNLWKMRTFVTEKVALLFHFIRSTTRESCTDLASARAPPQSGAVSWSVLIQTYTGFKELLWTGRTSPPPVTQLCISVFTRSVQTFSPSSQTRTCVLRHAVTPAVRLEERVLHTPPVLVLYFVNPP